ncbi:MAG: hypothetical protein KAS67_06840 [Thermoplasmata archaeon]|nr:hypothetical protein [Thermoplasmata archaeon]
MKNIRKILAISVVTLMVCASIAIVLPNITVTAEDSAKPVAELNNGYPGGGMKKVAWHENGDYALAVNGINGEIWKYTRATTSWSLFNPDTGDIYHDVAFDDFYGSFYFVGSRGASPIAWLYNPGFDPVWQDLGSGAGGSGVFYGVEPCHGYGDGYYFLAVGQNSGGIPDDARAEWYSTGFSWQMITGFENYTEYMTDATWDYENVGSYYMVGKNIDYGQGIAYRLDNPGHLTTFKYIGGSPGMSEITAIDWCPDYATYNYALMTGTGGGVWKLDNIGDIELIYSFNGTVYDIEWAPDGSMAILVGDDGAGNGVLYHHYAGDNGVNDMSGDLASGTSTLYGVSVKGWTSPSSGLVVGTGGALGSYLGNSDGLTKLTVNAAFPHMFAIDMWDMNDGGQVSTLNTPVQVVGDTYTFYTEVNYTIGGVDQFFDGINNNTFLNLTAWFDDGAVSLTPPASDDVHRTRKFVARVYEEVGGPAGVTGEIIYPDSTTNEFVFHSVGCSGPFGVDTRYAFWINVTFGPQTRAADGTGFGGGPSGDIHDDISSFNDLNSWNFAMTVYDNDFSGASNTTYEEFGINMATNITAAGMPSVNAPPGSVSRLLAPNSFITYSANTPYYVNVSIEDLTSGGNTIFATYVNASLVGAYPAGFNYDPYTELNASWGVFGRAFGGAGQERMVWGNDSIAAPNHLLPEPNNGTSAHGPIYSNFDGYGATELNWWVNVPAGTNEGIYQSTITFKIGFY